MAATSSYSSFASDPFLAMPASQQPSRAGPSSSSKAKSRPISISLAPLSIPSSSSQPLFNPSYIPTTQSTYLHSPPSPAPFIGVNYSPGGSAWPSSGPAQPPTPLTIPSHYGPPSPYMVARECAGLAAGPRSPCSPLRMSIDGRDDDGSSYGFASALGHRSERLSPYPLDRRPSQKDKPLQQLLRRSAGPSSMPSAGGFPFPTTPPPTPPCSSADALTALRAMVTPPSHPAYALPTPPPSGHRDDPLFPIDDDCAESVSARALAHHTLHPRFAAQYRILGELGSGGFGFVVKAIRLADKRICAVKFIIIDKVPSHSWVRVPNWDGGSGTGVGAEGGVGLIPMEAFVLRKVRHENVVSFLDLFEQGPYFYLVRRSSPLLDRLLTCARRSWNTTARLGLPRPSRSKITRRLTLCRSSLPLRTLPPTRCKSTAKTIRPSRRSKSRSSSRPPLLPSLTLLPLRLLGTRHRC